nr:MAG TPA: hypothetical protein [Caudoviricetes sp.]
MRFLRRALSRFCFSLLRLKLSVLYFLFLN